MLGGLPDLTKEDLQELLQHRSSRRKPGQRPRLKKTPRLPETCLPGDLPTKGPAHQEPAIQEPGTQESIAQRPAHQEPAQTLPPVCCSAPNCDYSTPVGANADTALKFLKIHTDMAHQQQVTEPATAAG